MAQFKYLESAVTGGNCIHEEVKHRLNLGNACYHSMSPFKKLKRLIYTKI
jgi:hypothetical protein